MGNFNPWFLAAPAAMLLIGWAVWSIKISAEATAGGKIATAVAALTLTIDSLRSAINQLTVSNRLGEERHDALAVMTGKIELRLSHIENDLYKRPS